jgi:26S proteasome regulatory subunit N1
LLNYKAAAVLGIGLVALGEDIGSDMAKRSLLHVLLADTVKKTATTLSGRKALPLAYALLSASNPDMTLVETISRLTHDGDLATAQNAVLALGVISAGSSNARVATMLRNLSGYYHREKDSDVLFLVRIAQGLNAMGKGHLTVSPLQQDRLIVSPTALMGLLGLLHSALDLEKTILDKFHFMIYSLVPAINPRMLLAVDSNQFKPIDKPGVTVRVGIPVDTVALPGKPKSITGFQTITTPYLMNDVDRAEVASAKHRALTSHVEGIVVVEDKPALEQP